jgi:ABC-2 type transport system permease protein
VPLLVALVTGDLIAGEANMGTLRLLLTKPYSRTQILTAKFLAGLIYTFLILLWMAVLALFLSMALFGTNDLINSKSGIVIIINGNDVFWRYLCAFGYAFIALASVASLSFMLSVFSENSIGPIVATMSIIIVCTIISTMDLPMFSKINPALFTTYMTGWKGFFNTKSSEELGGIPGTIYNLPIILKSAGILIFHVFLFFGIALYSFKKKDILS